jgi:hypothetical protein
MRSPRTMLLAGLLAGALAVSVVGCSSGDESATTTTEANATTTTEAKATTTTTAGNDTTTTTAAGGGAECTRGDLISAALPSVDPAFDLVDDFGCEDGYAWIWMADDATDPVTLASRILKDENGQWVVLSTDVCGGASAGLPPVVLEKGCAAI